MNSYPVSCVPDGGAAKFVTISSDKPAQAAASTVNSTGATIDVCQYMMMSNDGAGDEQKECVVPAGKVP